MLTLHVPHSASRGLLLLLALLFIHTGYSAPVPGNPSSAVRTNGFRSVDLSAFVVPQGSEVFRQLVQIKDGLQMFDGIPFQVGEKVAVTGLESASKNDFYPTELRNLPVRGRFTRLHLLHTTLHYTKDGSPLAALVLKYADGAEETIRLGYGVHVRSWLRSSMENKKVLADPSSKLLPVGTDPSEPGGTFRIFHTALANPRPNTEVTGAEFQSLFSRTTPVLLAMSLEDSASGLPPNAPESSRKIAQALKNPAASGNRSSLLVRVTDGAGGPPLTNALAVLTIRDDRSTFYFGEARADAQGFCRLPFPLSATFAFHLLVRSPNRIPQVVSQSRSNQPALQTDLSVALQKGVTIGGLVKGPDSKPVTGAQVNIHRVVKNGTREYTRTDYDSVVTDANGKWSSSSVPQDFQGFSFQVNHPEYRPALYAMTGFAEPPSASSTVTTTSRTVPLRPGPDGAMVQVRSADEIRNARAVNRRQPIPLLTKETLLAGQAEITLAPAIIVSGIVMDSSNKPVPKADLLFQRRSPSFERKYLKTDDAGRFRIPTSDPGDGAIIVLREGHTPKYHLLNIQPEMGSLEIRLAPARVLKGRVVDRQQVPVSGARVKLEDWMGLTDVLEFETLTDSNGRFTWTGAPPEQVTFYINKTNYFGMRHSVAGFSDNNEMSLILNRPNGIYGKVYDAETKQPIENFTIIRGRKYSQNEERIHWERYDNERGTGGEYSVRMEQYYFQPEARLKVEAFGYVPQISPGYTTAGSYTNDFALKRGKGIEGVVQGSDGQPLPNATVLLVEKDEYAYMDTPGVFRQTSSGGDFARTDSRGHFEFSPKLEPDSLFVSHEQGFAEVKVKELAKNSRVVVQSWGVVKGVLKVGDTVTPNQFVRLQNSYNFTDASGQRASALSLYIKTEPDDNGNFLIEKAPPGDRMLYVEYKFRESNNGETPLSHGKVVTLKAGVTNEFVLGGNGRKVTGYVKLLGGDHSDVDWKRDVHRLNLIQTQAQVLPDGRPVRNALDGNYVLVFETNGVFRVDNVPPGRYLLNITPNDPEEEYYRNKPLGTLSKEVVVPDQSGAKVNQPFDLGAVELKITTKVKMGKKVPPFEVKSFAGKPIKLEDFAGKHVLLYFYASTSYSTYDFNVLKDLQNGFGNEGKLVVLGMNLDSSLSTAEQFVQRNQIAWPQAFLGEWSKTQVPALFGVDGYPVGVLVDREGKLIARQLRSSRLRDAVRNAVSDSAEVSTARP
jgi:hypothetical protein